MRIIFILFVLISGCHLNQYLKKDVPPIDKKVVSIDTAKAAPIATDSTVTTQTAYDTAMKSSDDMTYAKASEKKSAKKPTVSKPRLISIRRNQFDFPAQADGISPDSIVVEKDNGMGIITYYIPDTMKVGIEYKVNLRIAKKNSVSISAGLPDIAVKKEIRVGKTMEAVIKQTNPELSAFKIESLNTAVQSIENDTSYTNWEWSIMPLKSGKHGLKLVIVIKENNLTKDIPVYEENIYVVSSPIYSAHKFIGQYWQWLMSSLVIPIFAWWFNKRKKKKGQ